MKEALDHFDAVMDAIGGCGDGNCLVKVRGGQHTNGGCRCWTNKHTAQRVMMAARRLRKAVYEELSSRVAPSRTALSGTD